MKTECNCRACTGAEPPITEPVKEYDPFSDPKWLRGVPDELLYDISKEYTFGNKEAEYLIPFAIRNEIEIRRKKSQ